MKTKSFNRSIQKLNNIEKEFSNSLTNPKKFLSDVMAFGTDWFEAFRKLGSGGEDELAQWARDNKLHEGAYAP